MDSPQSTAMMRVGPLAEIPKVLETFGLSPGGVLHEVGLCEADMLSEKMIEFLKLGQLLLHCSKVTDCDYFGLLVGSRATASHYGLIGELMRNAPTLGEAIHDWASNQHRFVRGSVIHLLNLEHEQVMTYRIHHPNVPGINQIVDTAAAAGNAVLRDLSGQMPVEVWLPRRIPNEPQAYRRVFGLKPQFDVSVAGLSYTRNTLAAVIPGADEVRRRELELEVKRYRAIDQPSFVDQVRRQLGARVTSGSATKGDISAELGVHERIMSQRLRDAGTSFRELTNETTFEVGCQMLANTDLTVARISEALGYSNASGFIKAFERRAGLSPISWREQAKRQLADDVSISPF